ncbi:MAG: hypothetical protein IT559_09525 [Alphaproteobacteria bacterium]|nr:hypothetical protein [Alphaproteobacteria bacterium]
MTDKTVPAHGATSEELREIFDFTTRMVADLGVYQRSHGRTMPDNFESNISRLEGYYQRFMPEIYGKPLYGLDAQLLKRNDKPHADGKLTATELGNIGQLRSKIHREINRMELPQRINEMQARGGFPPPVSDETLAATGQQATTEQGATHQPSEPQGVAIEEPENIVFVPIEDASLTEEQSILKGPSPTGAPVKSDPPAAPEIFVVEAPPPPVKFHPLPADSVGGHTPAKKNIPAINAGPDADAVYDPDVKLLQIRLSSMGHKEAIGEINGLTGSGTRAAMTAFAEANNLDPNISAKDLNAYIREQIRSAPLIPGTSVRSGEINPGVIQRQGEPSLPPATQTIDAEGKIRGQNGTTPPQQFESAVAGTGAPAAGQGPALDDPCLPQHRQAPVSPNILFQR